MPLPSRPVVVAGVDGSEKAVRAAVWAAGEAVSRRRPLVLVHALRSPRYQPVHLTYRAGELPPRRQAESMLADVADKCRSREPELDIRTRLATEHPVAALDTAAREAELVVLGPTGVSGFTRMLIGSTAAELVRTCDKPIVIVQGAERDSSNAVRRVVVGVDGSDTGLRAVGFAYDFADRREADLVAVHATSDVPLDTLPGAEDIVLDDVVSAGRELLSRSITEHSRRHPRVRTRQVITVECPVESLLEQAEDAALLVVGSHGRGAVRRALLGSVSHAVIHRSPCPVAVLRAAR